MIRHTSLALSLVLLCPAVASAYTVKRTANGTPIRWSEDRVEVLLDRSMDSRAGARNGVRMAVEAWRGLGGPDLELAPGFATDPYRPLTPGVHVLRAEHWPHAPQLLAVTASSYAEGSGQLIDADILLNPATEAELLVAGAALDSGEGAYDLGAILTHEAGHVLGLGESDADPLATMWPRIGRGDTHQRSLAQDDELGIADAYAHGTALTPRAGCGGASIARRSSRWPWVMSLAVGALLLWLAWRKRNEAGLAARSVEGVGAGGAGARRAGPATAGVVFAGLTALVLVPSAPRASSDGEAVRAARAMAAARRPANEREAVLDEAVADPSAPVRLAALRAMSESPRRSDRERLERLIEDEEARVRDAALQASPSISRARPARSVSLGEVAAPDVQRLIRAGRTERVHTAEVHRGTDGWTRTTLHLETRTLTVMGGCLDGVCLQIGEAPLPTAGERLRVATSGDGWVRVDDEVAWSGWLGDGPAVRLR